MPFNGSGVWSWTYSWTNDAANGIPITASRMDAQFDDAGNNGFDNCLTRDGQGSSTANTPWNGFKITGLGAATTAGDALSYGAAMSGPSLTLSGAINAAFGTTGVKIASASFTQTDSTTGAGTVATAYGSLLGATAFATASNSITITNAYGQYFKAPIAGSHVTLTDKYAIGADSFNSANTGTGSAGAIVIGPIPQGSTGGICWIGHGGFANTARWNMQVDSGGTSGISINAVSDTNTITGTAMSLMRDASTGKMSIAEFLPGNSFQILDNIVGNQIFKVDTSASSVATGIAITGSAAASGAAISVLSTGTNENLTIDAKGSGTITIAGTSTGAITITRATTMIGVVNVGAQGGGSFPFNISTATGTNAVGGLFINTTRHAIIGVSSGSSTVITGDALGDCNLRVEGHAVNFSTDSGTSIAVKINTSGNLVLTNALKLGNAYVATPQVTSGYVTLQDSTGTTYKVLVAA